MEIGKFWKLEADSMNVTLSHWLTRTSKEGKKYEVWKVHGYYATPKEALHDIVRQKIRDTELKDLETVVAEVDKLHKLISGLDPKCLPNLTRQVRQPSKDKMNVLVPF